MASKTEIQDLQVKASREADEARAMAEKAKDRLAQMLLRDVSDEDDLAQLDAEEIRAAADDFAGAVQALKDHEKWQRRLRELQIG